MPDEWEVQATVEQPAGPQDAFACRFQTLYRKA
jgi:hypothetical protein